MNLIILILLLMVVIYLLFWLTNLLLALIIGAPIVYSDSKAIIDGYKMAHLKAGQTVLDLGCGNAQSLIVASKIFGAKGVGVERSLYSFLNSKFRVWWYGEQKNIKIIFGDFKKVQPILAKTDVVYMYLLDNVVRNIENWLYDHIGPQTKIISLAFKFAQHKPKKIIETLNLGSSHKLYLYGK